MGTSGTSFRLSDEVKEQFLKIADSIGGTREQVFAKLMETYMLQEEKVQLSDRSGQIEQFEQYVSLITRMFISSLEDYRNVKEAVKTEFIDQLKSKDQIILELQRKVEVEVQTREQMVEKVKEYEEENIMLKKRSDQIEKSLTESTHMLTNRMKDKEVAIQSLTDMNEKLKTQLKDLEILQTEHASLEKETKELVEINHSKQEKIQQLNRTLEYQNGEIEEYHRKVVQLTNQVQEEQAKQEQIKAELSKGAEARLQFEKEKMQVLYQKKLNEHYETERIKRNQLLEEKQKQIEYYLLFVTLHDASIFN